MLKQSKFVIIIDIFRSVEVLGSIAIDDITFINCGIEKSLIQNNVIYIICVVITGAV